MNKNSLKTLQETVDTHKMRGTKIQELSDGYHTFNELYAYRKCYNALLFNLWGSNTIIVHSKQDGPSMEPNPMFDVHKSKYHHDGEPCFGGEYFVVVAMLPTGQISNHYKMEYWDQFHSVPEEPKVKWPYDNHSSKDALKRMEDYLSGNYKIGDK